MNKIFRYLTILYVLSLLILNSQFSARAYDNIHGIEYDDVVDVAFVRYINNEFSFSYTTDAPFRVTVNENIINVNFIEELIGMKIGETKPLISWYVQENETTVSFIEYFNTTIVKLIKDSTPQRGPIGKGFLIALEVIAGIGGTIGLIYVANKLRRRFALKKCMSCEKHASSKCSKCGNFYCSECLTKGCPNCGSRKFIRL
ncbi:MAG: hypothetical protein KAS63_03625 [Candidatus Heimdallarchaeota archaeon]|nr:hypothetical protein [Candidatus Heimdallarchaeota archaeon]MCK4954424.1 hypothetical protein [Candidatus Heimdallarchaeota archaeon]